MDRRLGHQGLPSPGGCRHHDRMALGNASAASTWKSSAAERKPSPEFVQRGHFLRTRRTSQYVASYIR